VSRFPSSGVDLAFVVPDTVPAADVLRTLREAGGELLESVAIFDTFRSDAIGAGRVSLGFSLRFRAPDRTLTDAEVAELRQRAIDAVVAAHGAELRA
jgi:phenylalanyl-tRNA synthetase beta chain